MTHSNTRIVSQPWFRRILPFLFLLQCGILTAVLWAMAHREPDFYYHQHVRLLLGSLTGCALVVAMWTERLAVKKWLLALTFALIAAGVVASVTR